MKGIDHVNVVLQFGAFFEKVGLMVIAVVILVLLLV